MNNDGKKTDAQWREQLSPEQYAVCRLKATEPAFTGMYYDCKDQGIYRCTCCRAELFSSEAKYDSGSGWPSFSQPTVNENLTTTEDMSMGMRRIEISCRGCGSHLGHLFDDGPQPTGQRYCINSVALKLEPRD